VFYGATNREKLSDRICGAMPPLPELKAAPLDPCCSVRALQADMRHRIVAALALRPLLGRAGNRRRQIHSRVNQANV